MSKKSLGKKAFRKFKKNISMDRIGKFFDSDNLVDATRCLEGMTTEDIKFSLFLSKLKIAHHKFVNEDNDVTG